MQLNVVATLDGVAQLLLDLCRLKVITAHLIRILLESQYLGYVSHYGELGPKTIQKTEQSISRRDHESAWRAVSVAVDLVVKRKDCL